MNFIYTIVIVFFGFMVSNTNKQFSKIDRKILNLLWLFHIFTSTYYYFFTRNGGGDAWGYWRASRQMTQNIFINYLFNEQGTYFILALNYFPANLLKMGFFVNTLFYGLLGFIAFIFLYRICIDTIPYNSESYKYRFFPLLIFLPNLHFWSSGVGKDTLVFLCILMFFYGIMRISKRLPLIIIAILLSYGIRPHITLLLVVSFAFAYFINAKLSVLQRILLLIPLIMVALFILPTVLEYTKIEEVSVDAFTEFSERKSSGLSRRAGSAIDISSYPYPLKILTFVYRPFFFDINGIPAVIASFENLLLLILSIQVIKNRFFRTFKNAPLVVQGIFIFFILGTLAFSMSMSNLGIILRQRNMFLPGLILFILWSHYYNRELVKKKS